MPVSAPTPDVHRLFSYLPEVPNFDPETVSGNISDEMKTVGARLFAHFAGHGKNSSFASWVMDHTKATCMNVYGIENGKKVGKVWAECAYELVATEGKQFRVLIYN